MTWPAFDALMNALAAGLLTSGYGFVRRGRIAAHRACMLGAVAASTLFLAGYLTYHLRVGRVSFPGTGAARTIYLSILLSHTVLAAAIVPLVLVTLARALRGRFGAHARLARLTLPLWLYVSVTGVVVYAMLYHWPAP